MRVRCSKCGAAGNVAGNGPDKFFKCPKCGGPMAPVSEAPSPQAPQPRRPPSSVVIGRLRAARRRARPRLPVGRIMLAVLVLSAAVVGGYWLYRRSREPKAGAKSLGLLPASTLAVASVDKVDRLTADLSRLGGTEWKRVVGALRVYRTRADDALAAELGVSKDNASRVVGSVTALGVGIVPVKGAAPATVTLLVLRDASAVADVFGGAASAIGTVDRKGRAFVARFNNTIALCRRREPLDSMAASFAKKGAGSLEQDAAFQKVRDEYCRRGRAWFYATAEGAKRAGPLLGRAAPFVPGFGQIGGFLALRGARVAAQLRAELPAKHAFYDQTRLPPRELAIHKFIPGDVEFGAALSLGEPKTTYDRLLAALDAKVEEQFSKSLRGIIRAFERQSGGLYVRRDIVPVLSGELGFFSSRGNPLGGTVLVGVVAPKVAQGALSRVIEGRLGSKPKLSSEKGLMVWTVPGKFPVKYIFVDKVLVVSSTVKGLETVKRARKSGSTLADAPGFRKALADLPRELTGLFFVRESETDREARHAESAWSVVVGLSTEKSAASVSVSVPRLAQLLLAGATTKRTPLPKPEKEPAPEPQKLRPAEDVSRENIEKLVATCRRFLKDKGEYPGKFADLITGGYIAGKDLSVLVRPGDTRPRGLVTVHPTSYRMAFDAFTWYTFTDETPGDLPMVWEIAAVHNGKRLVASFDGTIELKATERGELVKLVRRSLLAKPKKVEPPKPDEKKPGPKKVDQPPGPDPMDKAFE